MRRDWVLELPDTRDGLTLPTRIARAISADVRRGRLRPGDALPGARTLAARLAVSRNSVDAAYRELAAEGWARATPRGATTITADLPAAPRAFARRAPGIADAPAFALLPEPLRPPVERAHGPGVLVMAGGEPDARLVPVHALARAWRRAVLGRLGRRALSYGDRRGHPALRRAIAALVREQRGIPATEEHVLIVRGSQMGLDLAARAILAPGDAIAVETPGYRPGWAAFARTGARLVPVPVDADGLDVRALARHAPRAVYVTPHHQYPTTVTLSAARRLALLSYARAHGVAILEDDFDHELAFEGRPVLPLASADPHGVVVYVGTLSKVLAPGLRLGYVVGPVPLIERLASDRFAADRQGDHVTEAAAAALFGEGELDRHARRLRRVYRARRDALVDALRAQLGERLSFDVPGGGMSLWARVHGPPGTVGQWESRALACGAAFTAGRRYAFDDGELPFARIGFASLDERELREAVTRLVKAWPRR